MRHIIIAIILIVSPICLYASADQGCVRFYEHPNYGGNSWHYCGDRSAIGGANDMFSSVKLGADTNIFLFQHEDYKGKFQFIDGDVADLGQHGLNDELSSFELRPRRGCVFLYKHVNYGGDRWIQCTKRTDRLGDKNDQVSSFKLGQRTEIELWEHENMRGGSYGMTVKIDVEDMRQINRNDWLSSFKLRDSDLPAIHYLGCYKDDRNRMYDVKVSDSIIPRDQMTIRRCIDHCRENNYPFAALQYRQQCFCGRDYPNYERRPFGECDDKCRGNDKEQCGGAWRQNVFQYM